MCHKIHKHKSNIQSYKHIHISQNSGTKVSGHIA